MSRKKPDSRIVTPTNDEVREFGDVEDSWDSVDHFLAKGISFCVVHGNVYGDEVVSWCTCDCVAGDQIEVGIVTDSAHRRKGLAAVAAAATVECCLDSGFSAVGWHCESDNDGSWRTAEKVGFEREREYTTYYYIFDLANNLAQLGWSCLKRGEYERTTQYYEQVFALRDNHPDYYYTCAAQAWGRLENTEMTLKYLNRAIDAGWAAVEPAMRAEAFSFLHGTPEWEAVLTRMRERENATFTS